MGIFGSGNSQQTPKVHQLKITQSVNGIVVPIGWGCVRVPMNLLWYGDFVSEKSSIGGKGGGKGGSQYDYHAAILGLLGQGPVTAIKNVYSQSGALALESASDPITITQATVANGLPSVDGFNVDEGVSVEQSYSVSVDDYGSSGATSVDVTTSAAMTKVDSKTNLNSGEYYVDSEGVYWFSAADIGKTVTTNYKYSLYTLQSTEDYNVPNTSPYEITVQYQTNFKKNVSVVNILTGKKLTQTNSSKPGKGQYRPNGGNYIFSESDAGLAVAITYSWKQNDSSVSSSAKIGFTLIQGDPGQEAWTYLTSKHASQALPYSTMALVGFEYMDLGTSASMPDYNFECQFPLAFGGGIVDADLALVIQDFLKNPYYGAQFDGELDTSLLAATRDYWAANDFFGSPLLDSAKSASDIIGDVCEAGNVGVYWSEGKMKFVSYGDTTCIGNGFVYTPDTHPKVDLTDDDLIHGDGEDPITISRKPWQDAYNNVKVQFENRLNNYNPDIVEEQDNYAIARYGLRAEGQKDYSFLKTQKAAAFVANIRLQRNVYIRKTYKFKVSGLRYAFLEPMDLVTLTDATLGLDKTPVRLTEIEENEDRELDCTAEEFPWGTATATVYEKQISNPSSGPPALADPGDTAVIEIFEPSERVATTLANAEFQIWLALTGGVNWGGCHIWISTDGNSYSRMEEAQIGTSRGGELLTSLPKGIDPDNTDTAIAVINGQLTTVSEIEADNYATLCRVGEEYLSFAIATLLGSSWKASHLYSVGDLVYDGTYIHKCTVAGTSGATNPDWNSTLDGKSVDGSATWTNIGGVAGSSGLSSNSYELTYLRRGVFSSPDVEHPAGETFIRLDDKIYVYSYDPSLVGKTIYFKFTSFNLLQLEEQDLANVKAYPFLVQGLSAATNMTIDSILTDDESSAIIRIYAAGGEVTDAGTIATGNGAIVSLPAYSKDGYTMDTTYYVNWNAVDKVYVFYTDYNQSLVDQSTLGYLKVGSVMTAGIYAFIPTAAGGQVALGAAKTGEDTWYTAKPIYTTKPPVFDWANAMGWAASRNGWNSPHPMHGVEHCYVSTSENGLIHHNYRDGENHTWPGDVNWIQALYKATDVKEVAVDGGKFYVFTTPSGADIAIGMGSSRHMTTLTLPQGFNSNDMIGCTSMSAFDQVNQSAWGVWDCSLDDLTIHAEYARKNEGASAWAGSANWFIVAWKSSQNGVATVDVDSGKFVVIDGLNGHQIAIGCGTLESGESFELPDGFSAGQMSVAGGIGSYYDHTGDGDTYARGINCSVDKQKVTGFYQDGGKSHTWYGLVNWFAVCWK